ncbi:MAG: hypothetical protein GC205_10455 [Bacteroidetes bacterium]|nr:hypothetical protein [Bacteroidota bacterium]
MTLELIFLACGLFGAFCIGLFTALYASRSRQQQSETELTALKANLQESQEALDKTSGRIEELRERIAAGVDPEVYMALRDRYDLLEYEHVELERRIALGLLGKPRESADDLRFLEEIGIAITGEVPPDDLDDLTRIQGISPYLAERLKNIGIRTYDQIARLSDDQVRRVNDAIEILPGRIRREDWVGQCRRVAGGVKKS